MTAFLGLPRMGSYGAAKAGIISLTKNVARNYGPAGVTANAIHPGEVQTEMWAAIN